MIKILAIDDINDNLISLKAIVKDSFPESIVFSALNGLNGIEQAIAERPDVILLDIKMPGMDGFEVCCQIKQDERLCDIPVVFLTAIKSGKENRIKALEVGADAFLSKPIDAIELTAQIRAMVKIKMANELKRDEKIRLKRLVTERTQKLELSQISSLNLLNDLKAEIEVRRRTEEELKESEQKYRFLVENTADTITLLDLDLNYTYISPSVFKLRGFTVEEAMAQNLQSSTVPESVERAYAMFQKEMALEASGSANPDRILSIELQQYCKDGSIIWVENSVTFIRDASGKVNGIIVVSKNITERKRAEEKLRESEMRFKDFFEKAADAIFIAEADSGIIVDANQAASRLMKLPHNEIVGIHQSLLHPKENELYTKETFYKHKNEIELRNSTRPTENKVLRSDSTIVPVEILATEVILNGKKCLMGTFRDITDRKRAEEELNKSFSLLNATLESTADGILVVDKNGVITNFNKKFTELWRIPESMISTRDDAKLLSFVINQLKDSDSFLTKVKHLYLKIEETSFDILEFKDGRIFERYSQSQQSEGKSVGRVWSFRDITSRRQAEEKYSSIFENSVEGIYQSTPEGHFLIANPAMATILGFSSPEELVRERYDISKQGYTEPNIREEFKRQLETYGHVNDFEYEAICKDGSKVWVSENARLMHDANIGVYYEGSLVNITRRKKAEESLSKSHEALAHSYDLMNYVIEHDRSAVAVLDKDLKYIYVSQRYRKDFNVGETDIIGKPHYEVFPDLTRKWKDIHARALAGEILSADDDMYISEDGSIDYTCWECRPWYGPDDSVGGIILYIENTTERKKVEAELIAAKEKAEESDRLKSSFLSNMSHEIRTPLNSIIGFSDLMLDSFYKSDQHAEFAGIIKENGNNLLAIISDIMDISKIEAGQVQIKKRLFSVNKLIIDIHKEFSFKTISKGIELWINPLNPIDDIFVESDEIRLRQVLVNLVGNAIKFTEKGSVIIDIKTIGNFVEFQVIDTGIGIPEEFQEQVFERFRQVETANTRKFGGNGLGLAISKSLVELLGGAIWMESEKGKGSVFHFTIPT